MKVALLQRISPEQRQNKYKSGQIFPLSWDNSGGGGIGSLELFGNEEREKKGAAKDSSGGSGLEKRLHQRGNEIWWLKLIEEAGRAEVSPDSDVGRMVGGSEEGEND